MGEANPSAMKTVSESLFEKFCDRNSIRWEKIPTANKRTADYTIFPTGIKVVAEVKQIDRNKEDEKAEQKLNRGELVESSYDRGKRVGAKIRDANPKLAPHSKTGVPTILVLYGNVRPHLYTDAYDVRAAMYGVEQHFFVVSKDPSIPPFFGGKKLGPNQGMTRQHNTSISALAVMSGPLEIPELVIYHNVHARVSLPPEYFRPYTLNQFSLAEAVPGKYQEWGRA